MRFIDKYFALWAVVIPVTSVIVLPIQGSTPGYLLAFLSLPVAIFRSSQKSGMLLKWLIVILAAFLSMVMLGQFGLILAPNLELANLPLVDPLNERLLLKDSLITQSLYFLTGILTFVFVMTFYNTKWDRYIFWGAALLAAYGLYEFFYYLAFHQYGDFLSNRTFEAGNRITPGSLSQSVTLAGTNIMRVKSLTGEPSMYAFTVLPFWIYAIHRGKWILQAVLLVTLLLTFSTTAVFGIGVYLCARLCMQDGIRRLINGKVDIYLLAFGFVSLVAAALFWQVAMDFVQEMIIAKFTLSNVSGAERFANFWTSLQFFLSAPILNQLFGIGFGYIRSTDFFTTLLVNNGVIGFLLFSGIFLYPVFRLDGGRRSVGLRAALLVVYATMMIAVPEFAYLSIWLFLGIAFNTLRERGKVTHAVGN
jgi:hypothetical protein